MQIQYRSKNKLLKYLNKPLLNVLNDNNFIRIKIKNFLYKNYERQKMFERKTILKSISKKYRKPKLRQICLSSILIIVLEGKVDRNFFKLKYKIEQMLLLYNYIPRRKILKKT